MLASVQPEEPVFNSRNLEITTPMAHVPLMLTINPFFPCKKLKQSARVSVGSIIRVSPLTARYPGAFHSSAQPFSISFSQERLFTNMNNQPLH